MPVIRSKNYLLLILFKEIIIELVIIKIKFKQNQNFIYLSQ